MVLSTFTAIVLWASQMTLGATTGQPVEGVVEHYADGSSWVGAITEFDERSTGVFTDPEGSVWVDLVD